jgi:hypothetical protein
MDADAVPRGAVSGELEGAAWAEAVRNLLRASPSPGVGAAGSVLETLRRAQQPAPARRAVTRDRAVAAAERIVQRAADGSGLSLGAVLLLIEADEIAHLAGAREAALRGVTGERPGGEPLRLAAWRLALISRLAPAPGSSAVAAAKRTAEEIRARADRAPRVFADVNGVAIASLALSGSRLGRPDDLVAAQEIASGTMARLGPPRSLKHGIDDERSLGPARLGDYAALGWGLMALHEATGQREWLAAAQSLADTAIGELWDSEGEGFFLVPRSSQAPLPVRVKTGFDSDAPSANATMALFLSALSDRSGRTDHRDLARRTVQAFAGDIETAPSGMEGMLAAALRVLPEGGPAATAVPTTAPAAPSRVTEGPLTLELRPARTSLRAGEGTELFVRMRPAPGFVVTPHTAAGRGVVPLSVALLEPDLAAGPATYGPATLSGAYDGVMVPIRVPQSASVGPRRVRVSVRAQACTAEGDCRPPVRVTLEVGLSIVAR